MMTIILSNKVSRTKCRLTSSGIIKIISNHTFQNKVQSLTVLDLEEQRMLGYVWLAQLLVNGLFMRVRYRGIGITLIFT